MNEVVRIEDLSYSYPDGQKALSHIQMSIRQGESVALIGPNGAGKSTLLLHLNGILRTDGRVSILGETLSDRNLRWVRSKVGLVFQNPDDQLFSPTVFEDVAFGPINLGYSEEEVKQAVSRALGCVGMSGYEKRSPHHLSLGEKKRVSLATVLAMSPEILAVDEPTSSLDPRSKWALVYLLRELPQTRVIASHDLELVQAVCSRAVIIDRGEVIADGTTAEVLADQALLAAHGLAACR